MVQLTWRETRAKTADYLATRLPDMDMSTSIARRGLEDGAHTADLPGVRLGCGQLGMAHGRRGVAQGTG